jgi:hypothetical protein
MISRRSAIAIGEAYAEVFTHIRARNISGTYNKENVSTLKADQFYDFLFERDYEAWFCNKARLQHGFGTGGAYRAVKYFISQLHTGETQADATKNWDWQQRKKLGQRYLRELAEDILKEDEDYTELRSSLELDGYIYRNSRLHAPESDVLDVQEATGVLDDLYASLALDNKQLAWHHLEQSEAHFIAGRWDDTISNSRKFLECVLSEAAAAHSIRVKGTPLPERTLTKPVEVREYLEREGLLEKKEKEALASVYGLLSHTGSHPYMAQNDQARLLRQLALTLSQFALLRLEGTLKQT